MFFLLAHQLATIIFAADLAPVLAATAAMFSALLAGATTYTAQRTRHARRDVDAVRVTQDALVETIGLLRQENIDLRRAVSECRTLTWELKAQIRDLRSRLSGR